MNQETEHTILIGRLGRTVGLDGGLLFRAADASSSGLLEPGLTVMAEGHGPLEIVEVRRHPRGHVLHFRGVRRVERAVPLVNADLRVEASSLPEGYEVPVSLSLTGLTVTVDGVVIGTVRDVAGAAGFEYAVLEPGGSLLPLHAPYVNVTGDGITVTDPPEGLLQ